MNPLTNTPWHVDWEDDVLDVHGDVVARVDSTEGQDHQAECAHLIFAAPELLQVAHGWHNLHQEMVSAGGEFHCLPDGLIDRFAKVQRALIELTRAAIAKATRK